MISSLVDKINDEDAKDAAEKEGNESNKVAQETYFESLNGIIENQTDQTGVEEWDITPNSKEQHQLVAVLDYEDALWEGAGCFNLCSGCGRAFGGKYWWDRDRGTAFSDRALSHLDQSEYPCFSVGVPVRCPRVLRRAAALLAHRAPAAFSPTGGECRARKKPARRCRCCHHSVVA